MLLMPTLQAIPSVRTMHSLLPFRPAHRARLRIRHDTHHLIGSRQLGINSRRKRMNQLGPVMIPKPQHGTTVGAEIPLRRAALLVGRSLVFDRIVFPVYISIWTICPCLAGWLEEAYLINPFPLAIFKLSVIPPRLTLPL